MEIKASTQQTRTSTRKVRLVADSIRDLSVTEALDALSVMDKRGARVLWKTLKSAIANATNNAKLDKANLKIKRVDVLEGPSLKRYHPSTRGRVHPYKRRSSNVTIVLAEKEVKAVTTAK